MAKLRSRLSTVRMDEAATDLNNLRQRALLCTDAPLLFADAEGTELRSFEVRMEQAEKRRAFTIGNAGAGRQATPWDECVAVTNDGRMLEYLAAKYGEIPVFPAAGDRPAYLLNPGSVRVGVLTTGGPAPGLCAVVDSITKRHHRLNRLCRESAAGQPIVFGYLGGFEGLAKGRRVLLVPSRQMTAPASLGQIEMLVTDDRALEAATFLKTSRFGLKAKKMANSEGQKAEDAAVEQRWKAVLDGVFSDELDIVYLIGGDGTLAAANELRKRFHCDSRAKAYRAARDGRDLIIVGAPKTMDNDVQFADTTFGFTTTVDYLVDAIQTFHKTVECQDRLGLMHVFGAASGFVALYAAFCSGEVDYVILPEEVERRGIELLCGERAEQLIGAAKFVGIDAALKQLTPTINRAAVQTVGFEECLKRCADQVFAKLRKRGHALVVVAEGAPKVFQHTANGGTAMRNPWHEVLGWFKDLFEGTAGNDQGKSAGELTNDRQDFSALTITDLEPRYLIRDKEPRSYDIALCKFIGNAMVDAAMAGYTDCMVSRWRGRYALVPLALATFATNQVNPSDYFYRMLVEKYGLYTTTGKAGEQSASRATSDSASVESRLRLAVNKFAKPAELTRMEAALALAKRAHAGQTRKQGAEYLVHPLHVAEIMVREFRRGDMDLVAAALLHDVLEDAPDRVTATEIESSCGKEVLEYVRALTGPTSQVSPDRKERDQIKASQVQSAKREVWLLKLADRIDNLRDLLALKAEAHREYRLSRIIDTESHYLPLAIQLQEGRVIHPLVRALEDLRHEIDAGNA